MFTFNFDIDDADEEVTTNVAVPPVETLRPAPPVVDRAPAQPWSSISLAELIKLLPNSFSYSPLAHPLGGAPLLRRDLFDARFQLAQGGGDDQEGEYIVPSTKEYVDADTDLIPGTYEGGLKSWEGGLDLVEVIARNVAGGKNEGEEENIAAWASGSRVLEVGCGTGIPSAYLLRALLSTPQVGASTLRTVIHLQDYNLPVLALVTLPNLILASLAALPVSARTAEATPDEDELAVIAEEDEDEVEGAQETDEVHYPFDPLKAGNLDVTPALLDGFTSILEERGIELRFSYGDWNGMARALETEAPYGLVLTAETIYAEESVASLIDVVRVASRVDGQSRKDDATAETRLEDSLGSLSVRDEWASRPLSGSESVVLVAAKVLYFGVGGGLESFLQLVTASGGWYSRIHNWVKGVGRAVVRVGW